MTQPVPVDLNVGYDFDSAKNFVRTFTSFTVTKCPEFNGYTRLLLLYEDPKQAIHLNSQSYDILSLRPKDEKLLQLACSMDIDIISLDLRNRFNFRHSSIKQALTSNIFFELCYSQALDEDTRHVWMGNARQLIQITRGRNLIFSSGALNEMCQRDLHSVKNLALILGLEEKNMKQTFETNPQTVMRKAATRKLTFKGICAVKTNDAMEDFIGI